MMTSAFFPKPRLLSLAEIVALTGASIASTVDGKKSVGSVAPLESATVGDLTFLENSSYAAAAQKTGATACFIASKFANKLPSGTVALVSNAPYRAFAQIAGLLYPSALRPGSFFGTTGIAPGAFVHPDARLENDVIIDPGAIIGPGAEIGAHTIIGPHAVIGPFVKIGRHCSVGAGVTLQHSLIGNRVIFHPGVRIGQDGFGFAMGPGGHLKVPQVGRVIIQDDVEIGANTTIDRGTTRDTVIGEGSKIDNLVQIGHNVTVGRHCVIVSHVGISGSASLEDYVVLGGQVGVAGHICIGIGAQVGAQSGVMSDLAGGGRYLGSPAKPARQTMREVVALSKLAASHKDKIS